MGWICKNCNKKYEYRKSYLKHSGSCDKNTRTIEDIFSVINISDDKKTNLNESQKDLLEKAGLLTPNSCSKIKNEKYCITDKCNTIIDFDYDIDDILNDLLSVIRSIYFNKNYDRKKLFDKISDFKEELKKL